MNKKANGGFIAGLLFFVTGLILVTGTTLKKCVLRMPNGMYDLDAPTRCFQDPTFWTLIVIGMVLALVGIGIGYATRE